jgi:YbbR domain-containing protein
MKRFLRNLFIKNWALKLFSLFVALIIWITLMPEEKTFLEKDLAIRPELYNTPPEMELVGEPPSTVDIKIRAPKSLIDQITPANVHAVLNLENARVDQRVYPLNKSMISIPAGAEVKEIYPSQVNLVLERTQEIALDVEPNITGKPKEGFKIEAVKASPPQVLIRGAESRVKACSKVRTSPIDISGLSQSAEFEAVLIVPKPDVRFSSLISTVKVSVLIQKETPEEKEPRKKKAQKK